MTTFWKPTPNTGPERPDSVVTKTLGNRVYVLWCRCDICHLSDVCKWFLFLSRGDEHGEICYQCCEHKDMIDGLKGLGWNETAARYTTR